MRSDYKPIGKYVRQVSLRNNDFRGLELKGIRINKEFMPSVANVTGTDLSKYKIVQKHQFAFNPMHVGRDEILPVSMLEADEDIIVSPAYIVFEIIDKNELAPEYLMMWCRRPEFDRNAWFTTDSSVRGGFSWDAFCEMELPVPSIEKQREIVKEYNTIVNRIKLNEQLNQKLEEAAQAIYKQWFVDFEFPISEEYANSIGKPELIGKSYKSNGGEMIYNEELDQEIPRGWGVLPINKACEISSSKRIFQSEYSPQGVPFYRGKEIILKKEGKPLLDPLYISKDRYNEIIKTFEAPRKGDILMTAVGTLGVSYLVQDETFYFKDGNVIWFKAFKDKVYNLYLYDFMQSHSFSEIIKEITIGSTQKAITIATIGEHSIIIPNKEVLNKYYSISNILNECLSNKKNSNIHLYELKDILLSSMASKQTGGGGVSFDAERLQQELRAAASAMQSYLNSPAMALACQQLQESYIKSLAPAMESIQQLQELYIKPLAKTIIALQPRIKYLLIDDSHFYISDPVFNEKLENDHPKTTKRDTLLKYIEEFYSYENYRELIRIISNWENNNFIEKRIPIISSCKSVILSATNEKDIFNLVIPILIIQIDGMAKDFYIKLDPSLKEKEKRFIRHYEIITNKNKTFNELAYSEVVNICSIIHYLFCFKKSIYYFDEHQNCQHFIEKASEKELESYILNRNGILHGSKLDYGNKIELIRLVLSFDTMLKTMTSILDKIDSNE